LDLFAKALNFDLHRNHNVGDGGVLGLGRGRVHFAREFLEEKIEALPLGLFVVCECLVELLKMTCKSRQFFGDVPAVRKQRRLLDNAIARHRDPGPFEELRDAAAEAIKVFRRERRGTLRQVGVQLCEEGEALSQISNKINTFSHAHRIEVGHRTVEGTLGSAAKFGILPLAHVGREKAGDLQNSNEGQGITGCKRIAKGLEFGPGLGDPLRRNP
jgi:hypothetical protein